MFTKPYVEIIEQPAPDRARFRYENEGLGVIFGKTSTNTKKTYPTIRIAGHKGKAVVVVSCVTKDEPYRPHPFLIDGKSGCKKGVCTVKIGPETNIVDFPNIAVKCVKKKNVCETLRERQSLKIDPFGTGFNSNPFLYDYNSVRLCFQVLLEDENGKFTVPLTPVVSDPIFDKKHFPGIVINRISHCACKVDEELEMIILCSKVCKGDILVRFYEEKDGMVTWEDYGSYKPLYLHKQVAIIFRAPKYKDLRIIDPVKVHVQLRRPSDGITSESIPFEFTPSEEIGRKRKIPKIDSLLNLARCFDERDYNPFLNIRTEKNLPLPMSPEISPNRLAQNVAYNTYQVNLPSPSCSPKRLNIPATVFAFQSEAQGANCVKYKQINTPNKPNNETGLDYVQKQKEENSILEGDNSYVTVLQNYFIGCDEFNQHFQ